MEGENHENIWWEVARDFSGKSTNIRTGTPLQNVSWKC
jgi:hypothetical protein